MPLSLNEYVAAHRHVAAQRCFREAMLLNRLAHSRKVAGRQTCFRRKTALVVHAIRLAPEIIVLDELRLLRGGVAGLLYPGVGRLHVKLHELPADVHHVLWAKLENSCRPRLAA